MIGENHCLIFGGLVCKGQYHKTNVTKDLGILLYVYSTLYHIDLSRIHFDGDIYSNYSRWRNSVFYSPT